MSGRNGRPGLGVAGKLFAILDHVDGTPQTVSALARLAELPISTVHRLVQDLVAWGGLERLPDGTYRIGPALWRLANLDSPHQDLREIAVPYMHDLASGTGENVHLAVLDGDSILFLEKLTSRSSSPVRSRIGARMPIHATGAGKALLAFAPKHYQDRILHSKLVRVTPNTVVAPGLLHNALRAVREIGFVIAHEEMCLGSVSVAAPILGTDGHAVAALSVVSRRAPERFGPAVRTATNGISRELRQYIDPSRSLRAG